MKGPVALVRTIVARLQSEVSPANSQFGLERSWDMRLSFARLKRHQWRIWDAQYLVMVPILTMCFFLAHQVSVLIRLALVALLFVALTVPILSQFWLPFMPIGTYLLFFFCSGQIPASVRPAISVRILPALESILYGGDLSEVLASSTNPVLDLLAWVPYGMGHFALPFVVSPLYFIFGPPGSLPVFCFAFGWMNVTGVAIQILFPAAPPWYQNLYGLQPANYSMQGSPGGLARIDELLGLNLYTGTFSTSPMIFGAFPSLHSGSSVMEALMMAHLMPRYSAFFYGYVLWIWWSTMYLTHHYFVDLTAGAVLSFTFFYLVKLTCLPRIQPGVFGRWGYDYVDVGDMHPSKARRSFDQGQGIPLSERMVFEAPQAQSHQSQSQSQSHSRSLSVQTTFEPKEMGLLAKEHGHMHSASSTTATTSPDGMYNRAYTPPNT